LEKPKGKKGEKKAENGGNKNVYKQMKKRVERKK